MAQVKITVTKFPPPFGGLMVLTEQLVCCCTSVQISVSFRSSYVSNPVLDTESLRSSYVSNNRDYTVPLSACEPFPSPYGVLMFLTRDISSRLSDYKQVSVSLRSSYVSNINTLCNIPCMGFPSPYGVLMFLTRASMSLKLSALNRFRLLTEFLCF